MGLVGNWMRSYWPLAVLLLTLAVVTYGAFTKFAVDESTFLAIFIPASVGVIGSYGLYLKRRVDDTRRLRKALCAELEGMTLFQNWPTPDGSVPAFDPVATQMYDRNTNSLGLLSNLEITHVVEFYSRAQVTRNVLGFHGTKKIEADTSMWGQDTSEKTRTKEIVKILDRLALSHRRAWLTLRRRLEPAERQVPRLVAGTIVTEAHPLVTYNLALCAEYGLLETDEQDRLRVTEKGELFFEGELSTNNLDKEVDLLRRDEGLTTRFKRGISRLVDAAAVTQSSRVEPEDDVQE